MMILKSMKEIIKTDFQIVLELLSQLQRIYLRRNYKWCPGDQDEQAGGEIVDNEILGVVSTDVHVEPSQGEIA